MADLKFAPMLLTYLMSGAAMIEFTARTSPGKKEFCP